MTGMEDKYSTQRPVSFFVEGEPVAQPRPKFASRGKFGKAYTPRGPIQPWREKIALVAASKIAQPISGPIEVSFQFWFKRPKSHFRSGRFSDELKPDSPILHTQTPDIDNLSKAVLDSLVKKQLISDDSNVIGIRACKRWVRPAAQCDAVEDVHGVLITISPVNF